MDPIKDLLQQLKNAKGDTRAQSALTAEFLVTARPESEREPLRASIDAAAILHWFDAGLLEKMLEIPWAEARNRVHTLAQHSFVEPYRGVADQHFNLHDSTRLGWRRKFAGERPEQFRALSFRASSCFADDLAPPSRVEWIYHLLCADPDLGAAELEKFLWALRLGARPEDHFALAAALQELEDTKLIHGRARAWTLLAIAWARVARGQTAQLAALAAKALRLARECRDKSAEADAGCLTGDVLQAQGNLSAAQAAFDEALAISRRLVAQDLSNIECQRELGVALNRVGDVLLAQGKLEAARAVFDEALIMSRRLAEREPDEPGGQRELAVALNRTGDVFLRQGKLKCARSAFDEAGNITQRLARQHPRNSKRQRELAWARGSLGYLLQIQGNLEAAQVAFDEVLAIARRLVEEDPDNAEWQRELAMAYTLAGGALIARHALEPARVAFDAALVISRRLADQDSSNADRQRNLALAYNWLGDVEIWGQHKQHSKRP